MELEAKLPVVTGIICAAAQEKFNSITVNWHYYITVLLQNPYQKKKKKVKDQWPFTHRNRLCSFKMLGYVTSFHMRQLLATMQSISTSIRDKTSVLCFPKLKSNELQDVCFSNNMNTDSVQWPEHQPQTHNWHPKSKGRSGVRNGNVCCFLGDCGGRQG